MASDPQEEEADMGLAPFTVLPFPETAPERSLLDRLRSTAPAQALLRADALYLVTASLAGFVANALGTRVAGIGFGEAHELALIAGLLLWHPSPRRCWHLAAAAVHALLAAANLAHWETLAAGGAETVAAVTTAIHVVFVVLQIVAGARGAEPWSAAAR
jgi:hypothetical protein